MKAVKIILGIVIALTIVFLATGFVVNEVEYSTEVEINKPIAEVFSKFEDKDLLKERIPGFKSIITIEEKEGKIGSTYKMVIVNQENEITIVKKILAYEENKNIKYYFDGENMLKTDAYTFSSENGVTKVVKKSICRAESYLMGCLFPYFQGSLKSIDQEYLNKLKAVVEK